MIEERYELAKERILEITQEELLEKHCRQYFQNVSRFIIQVITWYDQVCEQGLKNLSDQTLRQVNRALYEDVLSENYHSSYGNPTYAREQLGEEYAGVLSALYVELRSMITSAYECNLEDIVIRLELWIEVYCLFYQSKEEDGRMPEIQEVINIFALFVQDYAQEHFIQKVAEQFNPTKQFAVPLIMEQDLSTPRYLYMLGEYITDDEVKLSQYLSRLPEEDIVKMAHTFTNGYKMGFIIGKKDFSKKKVVNIRYVVGFERVIKQAIENFAQMGLQVTMSRANNSIFSRKGMNKVGYYGAIANRQYEYDHREDEALILTKKLMNRKLEALAYAYEQEKKWAKVHGGPACMEVFGEEPFAPMNHKLALSYSKSQQQLAVEYQGKSAQITNEYCKPEERSYTIIAFPTPHIGPQFHEIFQKTIEINTLDYHHYERMQQIIIDTLDQATHVWVEGMNGNHTKLQVNLCELTDGSKETKFENCVADVNIPVGEVFTSPKLHGTNGRLHVTRVYLNGLEYRDLSLDFQDGMIVDYTCSNFSEDEENRSYVRETVLARRDTLPMGEFAIGTNTTAYAAAKKYGLEDKLPILIAEKMGPHFAIGDTCYSHSEHIPVCNPNGKEVVARENECSRLRFEESRKHEAYYYHHLDITIPYDELQVLVAVKEDGEGIPIIQEGRFVLEGLESLNEPLNW
ncbi:MAG: aminopeptidase [Eubacteriales bacterium]